MRIRDTTSYCGTACLIILLVYKLLFKVIRLCQQHFIFFPTETFCYVICVQLVPQFRSSATSRTLLMNLSS